eukprot:g12076.t1
MRIHTSRRICSNRSGYMVFCFQIFESFGGSSWGFVRELRLVRVIRVMRVARILQRTRSLKELRKLVSMMATCMKTLGWSFIFCFAFMTFWAMLMVEFVHPLVVQMQQEAVLDCMFKLSIRVCVFFSPEPVGN